MRGFRKNKGHFRSLVFALTTVASFSLETVSGQGKNPIEAAKDAWKKGREQQQQKKRPEESGSLQASVGSGTSDQTTGAALSSDPKLEAQVLVTAQPGLQHSISPRGQHLAAVVLRGSRKVVVHDSVMGC